LSGDEPWIAGERPGLADLHVAWVPKFALETIAYATMEGQGMGEREFPKVHAWLKRFEDHLPENERDKVEREEATKRVLEASYAVKDIGVREGDLTGCKKGDMVAVVTTDDTKPGNMAQKGKLCGLDNKEIVVELENGIRLHFSRIGYAIKKA
jgi:hypothetical protein